MKLVLLLCLGILALIRSSLQAPSNDAMLQLLDRMTKEMKQEQRRNSPSIEEIQTQINQRSLNSGKSAAHVLGELVDTQIRSAMWEHHEPHLPGRRGGCNDGQEAKCKKHGGKCTTAEVPAGKDHVCTECDEEWSGFECDVELACESNPPPCGDNFCMLSSTVAEGYICMGGW